MEVLSALASLSMLAIFAGGALENNEIKTQKMDDSAFQELFAMREFPPVEELTTLKEVPLVKTLSKIQPLEPTKPTWIVPNSAITNEQLIYANESLNELMERLKKLAASSGKSVKEYIEENKLLKTPESINKFLDSWNSDKIDMGPVLKQADQINQTLKESNNTINNATKSFDKQIVRVQKTFEETNQTINDVSKRFDKQIDQVNNTLNSATKSLDVQTGRVQKTLEETKQSLDNATKSFDNSVLNNHNAQVAQKSLIIGLMGLVVGGFSIKLLYEGVCDITTKLDKPEHRYKSWYQTLEYRDYFKPTLGLVGLCGGAATIAKSDSLAKKFTN